MKRKAIVVEKAPGKIALVLDTGDMPSGCCGAIAAEEAGGRAPRLTPGSDEDGVQSACAACESKSCSHMVLFPSKGRNPNAIEMEVADSSLWKLGQEVMLEFPARTTFLSALFTIILPLGLGIVAFAVLSVLFPALPGLITWLISLVLFGGSAWAGTSLINPRFGGQGVRIVEGEEGA